MTKRKHHSTSDQRRAEKPSATQRDATLQRPRAVRLAALLVPLIILLVVLAITRPWESRESGWPDSLVHGAADKFNVLVITLDTTRADRLGCYGYAKAQTPELDALARGGIRFDQAATVAPLTLPSHATIFTGLNPPTHEVRHNAEYVLKAEHVTLAEVLREQGYETSAFVSAFVLDARFGIDQGFDVYDDQVGGSRGEGATAFARAGLERPALDVTNAALRWFEDRDKDRPFFCWVHYFDPHFPYRPPPQFASQFRSEPYDGELAYMDSQIGRLLKKLEASGILDNTLVFAVGDHGESLGEHGEVTHAKLIYEAAMRVPLILSCPKLIHGPCVIDDVVVSVADIFPTVLDLLGIDDPPTIDGQSLLTAHADKDRVLYQETLAPYLDEGWSPLFGVRRFGDKYILAPRPEYYDLRQDPHELDNLHEQVTGITLTARDLLATDLAKRLAQQPSIEAIAATAQTLDPKTLRRLESLGYVGTVASPDNSEALPDPKDMFPVAEAIERATGLAVSGHDAEALTLLEGVLASYPGNRKALIVLGKLLIKLNRISEAEEKFLAAVAIRPNAQACIQLAQIMIADRRLDQAAAMLDQAEALSPRHGGIFLARGDLFALHARPDDAIASYEHAREVDPYRAGAEATKRLREIREFIKTLPPP